MRMPTAGPMHDPEQCIIESGNAPAAAFGYSTPESFRRSGSGAYVDVRHGIVEIGARVPKAAAGAFPDSIMHVLGVVHGPAAVASHWPSASAHRWCALRPCGRWGTRCSSSSNSHRPPAEHARIPSQGAPNHGDWLESLVQQLPDELATTGRYPSRASREAGDTTAYRTSRPSQALHVRGDQAPLRRSIASSAPTGATVPPGTSLRNIGLKPAR